MTKKVKIKNIPTLRFPGFDGEWEEKKLGELIENIGGTALEKFVAKNSKYKFISIGNYSKNGKYIDNGQRIILNSKTKTKLLCKNNLAMVLNDKTSSGDIIGSTILIDEDNKYIYNQRTERLICKSFVNPKFAWFLLNFGKTRREIFRISQGGTQIYVNFPSVKKLKITIPQKPEQEKVASALSVVDEWIENLEEQKKGYEQYKKAVMQKLFPRKGQDTPDLRFPEFSDKWEEKKLGEVCDVIAGKSKSKYIKKNGKNIIVDMGGISQDGKLIAKKKTDYSGDFLEIDELVMPKDDIGGGLIIGRVAQIPKNKKYIFGDHIFKLTNIKINKTFLYFRINSFEVNKSFKQKSNGTAQLGLSKKVVESQKIKLPLLSEQEKIASFLIALDDIIEKTEQKISRVEQWKKGLMQRLFV